MKKMTGIIIAAAIILIAIVSFAAIQLSSERVEKKLTLPLISKEEAGTEKETWYSHNTVCLAGLSLRDEYPGLTDKWYNAVPVDLTKDGVHQYRLVASNTYYIGSATVTVKDDTVTVNYEMGTGLIYPEEECLNWFTAKDQITGDYLENPAGNYKFGEAVSIKENLNSAETALLFICNKVTYRQPINNEGDMLVRYWVNLDEFKTARENMEVMMRKFPETTVIQEEQTTFAQTDTEENSEEPEA